MAFPLSPCDHVFSQASMRCFECGIYESEVLLKMMEARPKTASVWDRARDNALSLLMPDDGGEQARKMMKTVAEEMMKPAEMTQLEWTRDLNRRMAAFWKTLHYPDFDRCKPGCRCADAGER